MTKEQLHPRCSCSFMPCFHAVLYPVLYAGLRPEIYANPESSDEKYMLLYGRNVVYPWYILPKCMVDFPYTKRAKAGFFRKDAARHFAI